MMRWFTRRNPPNAPRSVRYATSPLLAAKTPPWRSKLLVAGVGAAFLVLIGRAAYIQVFSTDFYLKQGETRYARTLDLPANRGRITDLITSGQLSEDIGVAPIDARHDRVMLCGSPQMLGDMRAVLERLGFEEGSNSAPGSFVVEKAFVER